MTGRALAAAIAAPIAVFITLIGGFAMLFGGAGAASCTSPASAIPSQTAASPNFTFPSHPFSVPTATATAAVTSTAPGTVPASSPTATGSGSSPEADAAGMAGFDDDQIANAAVIVTTGAQLGVPLRGWIIAVAAAIQESGLRNLGHGDSAGSDSLGLFQQRNGWGSRAARLDPEKASRMFYLGGSGGQPGLLDITGWQTMPLTQAAQAVQQSAHPDAYAAREVAATQLVASMTGLGDTGLNPGLAASCSQPGSDTAMQAVAFARQQIGIPYQWGGNGHADGGFDCSGLTAAAYSFVGIKIPRTAQAQYDAGPHLPPGTILLPGDLVFFGIDTRHVTHVGIYAGDNQMIDAPHTGANVRAEFYRWGSYLGATRPGT